MKIVGLTFTYNEAEIVPFVMDYWKALGVDRLIVFDNYSTDDTVKMLKEYSFVEATRYSTEGEFNEFYLTNLRNQLWKGIDADYVIVTDFDEVPFYEGKGDFKKWAEGCGSTIVRTRQINVIREDFPEYRSGVLLHRLEGNKFNSQGSRMDKIHFWSPKEIKDINYDLGCHNAHPVGNVKYREYPKGFYFLHLRYLGKDYVVRKSQGRYDRLSDYIKGTAINHHYKDALDNYENEIKKLGTIKNKIEDIKNKIEDFVL